MRNYDIVLDSARLGIDGCAAVLKGSFAGAGIAGDPTKPGT